MSEVSAKHMHMLLVAYLAIGKEILEEDMLVCLEPAKVQQYLSLASEAIAMESLMDRKLVKQALLLLVAGVPVEETILEVFSLHIFLLCEKGSRHPLERGIIRQQIIGYLPLFAGAVEKKLIPESRYQFHADYLMAIADKTGEQESAMENLRARYSAL